MKLSFWDYVKAAFSARPIGMFVPPNWIGLGLFGFLGLLNAGFWVLGAGIELAYLMFMATHPRFQRIVKAKEAAKYTESWEQKVSRLVNDLGEEDQNRYWTLEGRCRGILRQLAAVSGTLASLQAQGEGLSRLTWIYLQLLMTRRGIRRILRDSAETRDGESLDARLRKIQEKLKEPGLGEDLRKSLSGQADILTQRIQKRREAQDKLAFLDAELTRIEQQVELIREQATLSTDPQTVSQRIDQITGTLAGTTDWIGEQNKILGQMEDVLASPPAMEIRVPPRMPERTQ